MIYRRRRSRLTTAAMNNLAAMPLMLPLLLLPVDVSVSAAIIGVVLTVCWFRSLGNYLKIDQDRVVIRNFWKTAEIPWDDVTAIDARRVFLSSGADLCLWFIRRSGKPVPAIVTMYPGRDAPALIDALSHAIKGKAIALPVRGPGTPRWYKKGSDSWQVVEPGR